MVIVPVDAFFFIGLTTAVVEVVVLTTVLGLEERCCIDLPMLPMAEEVVVSLAVEVGWPFLAMMRGFFFFFLGLMPIITLPLPDILVSVWLVYNYSYNGALSMMCGK